MAGRVKQLIDELVELRARGNSTVVHFLRAHLVLNGIDPDAYSEQTPDDPDRIQQLEKMIMDFRAGK